MKYTKVLILLLSFVAGTLHAQLPTLNVKNLQGKNISVKKYAVMPLNGKANGRSYSYMIYDSTSYTAKFTSVLPTTDSTYTIVLTIKDYYKKIYADNILLDKDSITDYVLKYVTDLKGDYWNISIDPQIAALEGYHPADKVYRFDDLDASGTYNNGILYTYRSVNRYRNLDDIKHKVFQELYWIHLFPGLTPRDKQTWKSSQAIYLDLDYKRIPSFLSLVKEGNSILVHQEIDQEELYKDKVTEEQLLLIVNSDPDDFYYRISSDGEYLWDEKLQIPKFINAKLTTTLNMETGKVSRLDTYIIDFQCK